MSDGTGAWTMFHETSNPENASECFMSALVGRLGDWLWRIREMTTAWSEAAGRRTVGKSKRGCAVGRGEARETNDTSIHPRWRTFLYLLSFPTSPFPMNPVDLSLL